MGENIEVHPVTGLGRTLARCQGWTSHEIDFRVNFRGFVLDKAVL